ncbi:helix-turn-helix domain-containing protein [Rhodococcus marinonascens]|uniref:helix-turn-helix domain-containing protein n=1 Tax=Rhodococcus marinonascens TaxID=38311 RepID=UPI0009335B63|nr:helix-turn-helix domain-containing protein [Rhodococcus marinonascens]
MSAQHARLLTIPQTMEALSLGRSKVFELIESGEIRSVKIGRSRRIPMSAINEYIERLESEQCPRVSA